MSNHTTGGEYIPLDISADSGTVNPDGSALSLPKPPASKVSGIPVL